MRRWILPQTLGPGVLVGLVAVVSGCTHHHGASTGESSVRWPSSAADSVRAVGAAQAELANIVHDRPWVVAAFIRDTGVTLEVCLSISRLKTNRLLVAGASGSPREMKRW
jgi:hypothetical protein